MQAPHHKLQLQDDYDANCIEKTQYLFMIYVPRPTT
jgi:hypothetical protein